VDAGFRSRSPTASADAACSSPRCWRARTVVSGLGGDEMVAVGSAESEQAALGETENFDLPWRGPHARSTCSPRHRWSG
jgi:hypothetical protein